jgi:SAM-dependent methyltransferase
LLVEEVALSEHNTCWCGNDKLLDFSPAYRKCPSCGTLVLHFWPDDDVTNVQDTGELYGSDYYLRHLPQEYGYPSLETRARSDISERVLFWAETLLRYKLPPSKVLELGSAHGGFVAFLRQAGFHASGLELSPWLVSFSRSLFEIPVLQGPLEKQDIEPGSLDAIVLMDVLEHLPDPLGTMRLALNLLAPDGILLIQTPCVPEEKSYAELVDREDPFLAQFKEKEHLFLFSQRSVTDFFAKLDCPTVIFEQAIFAHYDMFLVASRILPRQSSPDEISVSLQATSNGRIAQGILDLYEQNRSHLMKLQDAQAQLQDAQAQLQRADLWLQESYTELQIARKAFASLRISRLYKLLRYLGAWKWFDGLLNQIKQ